MDQSVWKGYKDEKAAYAIGGPTIELFINSFNATVGKNYPDRRIRFKYVTRNGYLIENNSLSKNDNKGIYSIDGISYWWTASPGLDVYNERRDDDGCAVRGSNVGFSGIEGYSRGLRPVVIIQKSKFNYEILPEL